MKRNLAHYLFQRLQECGAEYTFGIPGDFALPLYAQQSEYGMKTIVCTHEPSCVFAADAYSRVKGLGAVLTTYGVGGLNMINPVAMAYAEHSSVVIISGAPAVAGRKDNPAFHHLVKDYDSQQRVFTEVTCATAALTQTETAAEDIDRVLQMCLSCKRPGYIEIPLDMTSVEITIPDSPVTTTTTPAADQAAMHEAAGEIIARFEQAKRPVIYAGVGIRRYNLIAAVTAIAENWGIPVVSSVMGKSAFPESHPHHAGVYMGKMGNKQAAELIEKSDCLLAVGVIFSDVNSGFWTADIQVKNLIDMADLQVSISHHSYQQVPLATIIKYLAELRPKKKKLPAIELSRNTVPDEEKNHALTTIDLIRALQRLDQKNYSFLADVGDAWFAGLELDVDTFMAPGYYASMGFAVPGAVGAGLAAPDLRPLVLVGDGAFQMTGNELSTLVANNLKPIVIVLNNGYYKMLSALDSHRDYYNLSNWDYVKFAEALGCEGTRVERVEQLEDALQYAVSTPGPFLIEVILEKTDHAPMMQRIREYFSHKGDNNR